jgi:hypothetical protein
MVGQGQLVGGAAQQQRLVEAAEEVGDHAEQDARLPVAAREEQHEGAVGEDRLGQRQGGDDGGTGLMAGTSNSVAGRNEPQSHGGHREDRKDGRGVRNPIFCPASRTVLSLFCQPSLCSL